MVDRVATGALARERLPGAKVFAQHLSFLGCTGSSCCNCCVRVLEVAIFKKHE
jgi:hypothetical protein